MKAWPHLVVIALAALAPWLPRPRPAAVEDGFPGWPTSWEGVSLQALPGGARDAAFAAGFPGRVGRFACGGRELILRWVATPTRRLHPAADCLRADGWRVEPLPPVRLDGGLWSRLRAERAGERVVVRERIVDRDGVGWTDPASWWWDALRSDRPGWWAATVVEAD